MAPLSRRLPDGGLGRLRRVSFLPHHCGNGPARRPILRPAARSLRPADDRDPRNQHRILHYNHRPFKRDGTERA